MIARASRACAVVTICAATAASAAPGRKLLVLPLDGDADPALRTKLAAGIRELATAEGGNVASGDATMAETAAAVGCDAARPACIDQVIATLGVDEVVWGTATTTNGSTSIVVRRATKGAPSRAVTAVLQPGDDADKAKPTVAPFFGQAVAVPVTTTTPAPEGGAPGGHRDRNIGLALVAGGGAAVVVGVALWANAHNLQNTIDGAPTTTLADIQALKALEDRAANYALAGNIAFVVGLAAAGGGGYLLWRDHRRHSTIVPAPVEHGTGATLVVRGTW